MRGWADLCAGHDCDRKDRCRRHLYYVMLEARFGGDVVDSETLSSHARHLCSSLHLAFIDNDSAYWRPAPQWWNHL